MNPSPPSSRRPWVRWGVWTGFAAVWTILLLMPISESGENTLDKVTLGRKFLAAKIGHVVGYALLTGLCGWLRPPARIRWMLLVLVIVHAPVTEFLQTYVGRGGSLADVGLDFVGILLGLVLTWKWWTAGE